ncbi:hypothetical protein [Nostoc sp. FACHB-110]|uniref:hypothetical protein n=1 Tax=Nostoc sp. FACHB-110 TaxID=2692834 RepID=UPI001684B929|nr:hypothetical protein [Nostoc sp. FACHB-110]MBD2436070.1 hypothetical protein [Nostoc sp. FACHB-110]
MEKSQSVNHEPTQLIEPKPEPTKSQLGSKGRSNIVIYLLTQQPWLLLVGLFTAMLGTATVAYYSLSHVGGVEQAQSEPLPVIVEEPVITERSNPTPFWMVMAIALSCGSGCYVIFRLFNRPQQRYKVLKRVTQQSLKPISQPRWEVQTSKPLPAMASLQPLNQTKTKSLVAVLPPAQQYRLDKGKESLAELMDIRKEHSLSTLLQKY